MRINNTSPLADLDELVLRCRDDRARAYIAEATNCYRSGAYRSAIVATWIAVCYDIIDKLRELALAGDQQAEGIVNDIDRARRANDLNRALKLERELLAVARDKFELLSHIEFIDLERLQQDRNRCAHPSLVSEEEAFNPSGELARLHIRSAVLHLLQHPPVQGKYALERLLREVESEYFPVDHEKAVASFQSGPLRNPRESLIRNFVVVLLKNVVPEELDWKGWRRYVAALGAVHEMHPETFNSVVAEKLAPLVRAVPDERLGNATNLLSRFPELWENLEADVRTRIELFVQNLPVEQFEDLQFLVQLPFLVNHANRRISRATRAELNSALFFDLPVPIGDRYIELYLQSGSFDKANEWARNMVDFASSFTADQQQRILEGAAENDQITGSFELGSVIDALRRSGVIPEEEFENHLSTNGLEVYRLADSSGGVQD